MKKIAATALIFFTNLANAGYLVTGPIIAEDCYDFGVSICSKKTVTNVKVDGKLIPIANYFERVSKYDERWGICYIYTKDKSGGPLAYLNNVLRQPDFWGTDSKGKFGKIDADFIKFNCVQR